MAQIAGQVTDDVEELCKGKRDLVAEEGPRTGCHYQLAGNEPNPRKPADCVVCSVKSEGEQSKTAAAAR